MDTLTAVTLMMVEATPAHLPELASRVAAELLIPDDLELFTALSGVLERLVAAGLIVETAIA